ncbi:hypothetical protein NU195Hw_g4388t1 [Hortaea werneckii]
MHLKSSVPAISFLLPLVLGAYWHVDFYPDHVACSGDPSVQGAAGFADDTVLCLDASYTHDLETVNIESFGKHVRLYTDAICNDEIAHITSNGCHVTPEDQPIAAFTVLDE